MINKAIFTVTPINQYSSIERIKFGKIYTRLFKKWTRLDPYSYADRILTITHKFTNKKSDQIILFAGRIAKDKGVLELMQACDTFFKHNPSLKLVIVGDPDAASKGEHAVYQDSVKEFAENLGKQCIFTGNVHPEKIRHYYSIADLIAVPSIANEPFCMVALEAMASGRPVIVSQRGAMVEFVDDKQTGFFFREPLTIESMSQDLECALATANIVEIAAQAREYAYQNFNWEIVTKELQSVIDKWYQ